MSNAQLGKLIRYVLENKGKLAPHKLAILLLGRAKLPKGYSAKKAKLENFRLYDFKVACLKVAKTLIKSASLDKLKKYDIEKKPLVAQINYFITAKSERHFGSACPLADGEVAKLQQFLNDYAEIKALRRAGRKQTAKQKAKLKRLINKHKTTDYYDFEESYLVYDAMSMADLIDKHMQVPIQTVFMAQRLTKR